MAGMRIKIQKANGRYDWYRMVILTVEERDPDGKPMLVRVHSNEDTVFKLSEDPLENEFITAFVPETNFPSKK